MSDRLVRGLVAAKGLRAIYVRVSDTARIARMLHGLYPTSAHLFGEALAAGLLVASLQKERSRVNLQIECDGPIRGLFVDADQDGNVRGYVRGPNVNFPGDPAAGARAALGGSGFLSVMRDLGEGQFYRGQVELRAMDLARDLDRYFAESEQVATALDLCVTPKDGEPLGEVAGLLVQKLPDVEVAYRCGCSRERARTAVSALGREGIAEVLANEREAVITCEFCHQRYVIGEAELREIAQRLAAQGAPG